MTSSWNLRSSHAQVGAFTVVNYNRKEENFECSSSTTEGMIPLRWVTCIVSRSHVRWPAYTKHIYISDIVGIENYSVNCGK
jgi:hypothetical protein